MESATGTIDKHLVQVNLLDPGSRVHYRIQVVALGEPSVPGMKFEFLRKAARKQQTSVIPSLVILAGYSVLQRAVRDVGFVGQAL